MKRQSVMPLRFFRSFVTISCLALASLQLSAVSAHADKEGGNTSGGGDTESVDAEGVDMISIEAAQDARSLMGGFYRFDQPRAGGMAAQIRSKGESRRGSLTEGDSVRARPLPGSG